MDLQFIEDLLPLEAIQDICNWGDNGPSVEYWLSKLNLNLNRQQCISMISEYMDVEGYSLHSLKCSVLWIAAWNVNEKAVSQ